MLKNLLIISLLISSQSLAKETEHEAHHQHAATVDTSNPKEITVGVKGMVCAFCAQGIEKQFMKRKEVEKVDVSLEKNFIKIKFKPGQKLANKDIGDLLKDAGYEASFEEKK